MGTSVTKSNEVEVTKVLFPHDARLRLTSMPTRTPEHPGIILTRKRAILAFKITQERRSLHSGGIMAAPPAGYRYIVGQTRETRLADWERMLYDLDRELTHSILG
jgi:hypothetical protein